MGQQGGQPRHSNGVQPVAQICGGCRSEKQAKVSVLPKVLLHRHRMAEGLGGVNPALATVDCGKEAMIARDLIGATL
jgi:hypothetical protein